MHVFPSQISTIHYFFQSPPVKRRKVQFSDPPVSDLAEIPRTPSGQKSSLKTSLKTKLKTKAVAELKEDDSCGLYVATPPLVEAPPAPTALYPALAEATEPLGAVLNDLSSAVLQKLAEKSLAEVGVKSVGDLESRQKKGARFLGREFIIRYM